MKSRPEAWDQEIIKNRATAVQVRFLITRIYHCSERKRVSRVNDLSKKIDLLNRRSWHGIKSSQEEDIISNLLELKIRGWL